MLDAAVSGNVFASSSPDRVLKGIQLADTGHGVLLIIKNYAGDIMNFEIAEELAGFEGITVDHVVVKDDVAVADSDEATGRRGIAGTVFVHKIAGAKAEQGAELSEVKRVAEKTIENVRSFGVSLSSCTIPAVGTPGFSIAEDQMEIGMGCLLYTSRVRNFLSQPFHVAEVFSGIKGCYVSREDTVRSFKELLAGKYDELPEQAFMFASTIEEVVEKAKALEH